MRVRMVPAPARAAALLLGAALLASCVTEVPEVAADLTPAEYFQRAQEATARQAYQLALRWYAAFRQRYADDPSAEQTARLLWAEYETAFLYHKMDDDETALRLLRQLVRRYELPAAADYPPGPRILAQRVIRELDPAAADAGAEAAPEAQIP